MLKLLHTSDLHLGAKLGFLGDKSKKHREIIIHTFGEIVDLAVEKKVNVVIIAGDIFDIPFPDDYLIGVFNQQVKRLVDANIYTAVIPGNHDYLEKNSVWAAYKTNDFVNVLNDSEVSQWSIPDLKLHILARANVQQKSKRSPLEQIKERVSVLREDDPDSQVVVIAHGSVSLAKEADNYPISKEEIASLGADYLALGDWHGTLDVSQGDQVAYYSGSPELTTLGQENFGNVLLVNIEKGQKTKVDVERVSEVTYERFDLNVNQIGSDKIFQEVLSKSDSKKILDVTLFGDVPLGTKIQSIESIYDQLSDKFYFLKLENKISVNTDFSKMPSFPDNSIPKQFLLDIEAKVKSGDIPEDIAGEVINLGLSTILEK